MHFLAEKITTQQNEKNKGSITQIISTASGGMGVQRTKRSDDQMGQIKLTTKPLSNIF